jgi:hypothetical protein
VTSFYRPLDFLAIAFGWDLDEYITLSQKLFLIISFSPQTRDIRSNVDFLQKLNPQQREASKPWTSSCLFWPPEARKISRDLYAI